MPSADAGAPPRPPCRRFTLAPGPALALVMLVGVILQAAMGLWLPITGDEVNAAGIGREWVRTGRVIASLPGQDVTSHSPMGAFIHVVFGFTQRISEGVVSARVLTFALMVAAALLLAASLWRHVSPRFAVWFTAAYWLGPWTVYHAAMAWEPALTMALAAVVFSACLHLRERAGQAASAAVAWALAAALQVHGQFVVLVMAVGWLVAARRIRVAVAGALAELVIGSVTLWPGLFPRPMRAMENAVSKEHEDARLGFGLMQGYPMLRAAGFWFRMTSADLNRQFRENRLYQIDATDGAAAKTAKRTLSVGLLGLSLASVLAGVAACVWFYRRSTAAGLDAAMAWLRGYSMVLCGSLLVATAASPVCVQGYHAIAAATGAAIPFAAWCGRIWSSDRRWGRPLVVALFAVRVAVTLFVAVGRRL
ncbi:MAG: hypothetical protein NT029_13850 [Armatimonadetes bacterium]|nr:hypothetical protein [Armatimonadota bacterium]